MRGLKVDVKEIPNGISFIHAPGLWRDGITGKGVVVAILDSGCDSSHPDLAGRIIGGYNFTDD
ncbi:Major intracellular serine protease [Paenibacillus plantiphilus]|uniref:Major intracellular serine protease n=1 Tax=Paenibacillus plantiphilus TaxID=2905650 RepID=A0ABN8H9J1_9BACL|nr:Major intracellular serine protease [Paenibacillus plantiphilus]